MSRVNGSPKSGKSTPGAQLTKNLKSDFFFFFFFFFFSTWRAGERAGGAPTGTSSNKSKSNTSSTSSASYFQVQRARSTDAPQRVARCATLAELRQ
jgi:hypothetical protein